MSFLSDFEGRIGSVFGAAPQGYTEPFSFKKLAKRAAREMESETYEIDGVDTAPSLYTVLVSASDDSLMRPLYEQITYETSSFVQAQAQKKGYSFVGNPLVRFMVDPTLKSGRFAVFAENVDAGTLERLRAEERAFLGENSSVGGAAAQVHRRGPAAGPAPHPAAPVQANAPAPLSPSPDSGLDVMPPDYAPGAPVASASESTPMPVAAAPLVAPVAAPSAVPAPAPVPVPTPQTQLRNVPLVNAGAAAAAAHAPAARTPQPSPAAATSMLVERQTGRTFTVPATGAVIGRERSQAQVVLRDPNVSRAHAQISFDGRSWHITDLNSTNGTLVNDVDVADCVLRDGDLITVGLVNLEFRENLR